MPDLSALRLGDTGKSWSWDKNRYIVTWSIDRAIAEQLGGIQTALVQGGNRNSLTHRGPDAVGGTLPETQMEPYELLTTLREYTTQRLFDIECAQPELELPGAALEKGKGADGDLLSEVARWANAIKLLTLPRGSASAIDHDSHSKNAAESESEEREYGALLNAISVKREEMEGLKAELVRVLIDIEQQIARFDTDMAPEDYEQLLLGVARWMSGNIARITTPSIAAVRRTPRSHYSTQRDARTLKYMRWLKMHLVCYSTSHGGDADVVRDATGSLVPFKQTMALPMQLDGSFYSGLTAEIANASATGEDRVRALELEHIVPQSHLRSALLVREFADPRHIAFNTVFCFSSENSRKGDHFLPLTLNDAKFGYQGVGSESYTPVDLASFGPERRVMAARAVCATYLSLFMLERNASGHTDLGSREGGFYASNEQCKEAFEMATGTGAAARVYETEEARDACLNFERGLALLQFYYLGQPYNPLPHMAYKAAKGEPAEKRPLWLYYKALLFKRFRSRDSLSKLMRLEAKEEIAGMPSADNDGELLHGPERQIALAGLLQSNKENLKRQRSPDATWS